MKNDLIIIETEDAPGAIGPYSQAIIAGDFMYISGQIALDPKTMKVVEGGIREQTEQVMKNIESILKTPYIVDNSDARGGYYADLNRVVKAEIFLKDLNDFQEMNEVYGSRFTEHKPARWCVETSKLPMDVLVEISCTAYLGK
jgi:2-iminobutanoate/2-iminopropanoate deaminase